MYDLVEQVKINGVAKKENWLSFSDQNKIINIIQLINASKGDKKSWFAVTFKLFLIKLIKFQFLLVEQEILAKIQFQNLKKA